jgi:hypothetical protein
MEYPIGYDCIWPGLYLYFPYLQDLILYLSSKPHQFGASWPGFLGWVDRLMEGPLFLSTESRRHGTPSTTLCQQPPAWQASLILLDRIFLFFGEVAECSVRLAMTCLSTTRLWSILYTSDRVHTNMLRTQIGAPNRCSPWLPYQIFKNWFGSQILLSLQCRLLFLVFWPELCGQIFSIYCFLYN